MAESLASVNETLQTLYRDNLRALLADLSYPLWGDRTLTRVHLDPNLFPRARRAYRSFWAAAQRVEDAVGVLCHGLPEPEDNPW